MIALRGYQTKAIDDIAAAVRRYRRVCFQLPTGAGKTVILAEIVRRAEAKGSRVLFLAPRRELIFQGARTIGHLGSDVGLILAGEELVSGFQTYVASFDTLHARCVQRSRFPLPPADLVIVDEAHLSLAKTRRDIIDAYPYAKVIGVTATPCRGDGRGLGQLYDTLVTGPTIAELTRAGHLVPVEYWGGRAPDLSGVKLVASEYHQKQLEEVMDQEGLIGEIVENWMKIAHDKRTVVFCSGVKHSRHVTAEFRRCGVSAEHLDGMTPTRDREAILARVASGETQVLCNVFVASYGLDIPATECAVLARPTRSLSGYFQTCGRVLRTHPGKAKAIIIDHAGSVADHGFLDTDVPWTLDGNARMQELQLAANQERNEPKEIQCPACPAIFRATLTCPVCGFQIGAFGEDVPTHKVDLAQIERSEKSDKAKANKEWLTENKRQFFAELLRHSINSNYSPGWASHKYREKFGVWPNAHKGCPPATAVSDPTRSYIRHLQIKRAKSAA